MQKRNFIFLITVLGMILAIGGGYLYFTRTINTAINTTPTEDTNFIEKFLPFGNKKAVPVLPIENPTDVSGFVPEETPVEKKLVFAKVSSMPIAGYTVFQKEIFTELPEIIPQVEPVLDILSETKETKKTLPIKVVAPPTEFVPALRYISKENGNTYETMAEKLDERKFTATIIPKIHEAFWGDNGDSVFVRYLKNKTIQSFAGVLPKSVLGADSAGTAEMKGIFMPEDITNMSISPNGKQNFYIFNVANNAVGVVSDVTLLKKNQIFSSPFTEWLSQWPNERMITLTTKPSSGVLGYMYAIDPVKKDFIKILGDVNGLTTLTAPSGKLVLYNKSENNNIELSIYNTSTGDSNSIGLKTLPEKCVWSKDSLAIYCAVPKFLDRAPYPDAWYMGEISFADEIWKIDPTTYNSSIILDPLQIAGEDIDGIKLQISDNLNYLFLVNKKDSILWELVLS